MVEVNLWTGLRRFTGGLDKVQVEAGTVGEMLDALVRAHPALEPVIKAGISVAIDGEITNGNRHLPVSDMSEIHLLQQMRGG
ncbi:MAG: MoaD/ThiS family protein [Rhizobiaceae bacterium]